MMRALGTLRYAVGKAAAAHTSVLGLHSPGSHGLGKREHLVAPQAYFWSDPSFNM